MVTTADEPFSDKGASLAVLIDGDNVSPKVVEGLLAEIAKYGVAAVRRIYGNWTAPNLGGWKDCLLAYAIQPVQQFAYTTGKNATDGAMIIDAMDLLYTGRFDGFCLVSSDSDFVRLATRIREQGVRVYGFGERKTPHPFIIACDKFVYFDVLKAPDADPAAAADSAAKGQPKPKAKIATKAKDKTLLAMLSNAAEAVSDESGWAHLGALGSHIAKQSPEFDARNYGFSRLSDLVEASGLFEVKRLGTPQSHVQVRLKPAPKSRSR